MNDVLFLSCTAEQGRSRGRKQTSAVGELHDPEHSTLAGGVFNQYRQVDTEVIDIDQQRLNEGSVPARAVHPAGPIHGNCH